MKDPSKIWLPVVVLLVTISGQWFTVFHKMLDMEREIVTVHVLVAQHLKESKIEARYEKASTGDQTVLANLNNGGLSWKSTKADCTK